ncbi:MAG: hypothetical protein R2862_09430 [Thermoanaerobaculia bacterium]
MDTYEQTCGPTPSGQGCILNNPSLQEKKMVVARGSNHLLAYLPWNQTIKLSTFGLSFNPSADWGMLFNPKSGVADPVRLGTDPNYTCNTSEGWCEWENRFFFGNDAAASDRVFYISAPQVPAGFWAGESTANIQVFAAALEEGDRTTGPWGIVGRLSDQGGLSSDQLFYVGSQRGTVATQPAAARDGSGNFLVVWQVDADGDGWQEIRGRWVNGIGEPVGDAFRVSPEEERDQMTPSVAVDASGNAVVVWTTAEALRGANFEVWGQAGDSSGVLVGGSQTLVAEAAYDEMSPRIAASADGAFTLVWLRRHTTTAGFSLMTRQLNSLMRTRGDELELTSGHGLVPWVEAVSVDGGGRVAINWEERSEARSRGRYRQELSADGRRVGAIEAIFAPANDR